MNDIIKLMNAEILHKIQEQEDKKFFDMINEIIEEYDAKNNSNTKLNNLDHFKDLQEKLPPLNQ